MADQFITCTTCHSQIPLTQALRADIEESLKRRFAAESAARERELQQAADTRMAAELGAGPRGGSQECRAANRAECRLAARSTGRAIASAGRSARAGARRAAARARAGARARRPALTVARQLDDERQALIDETRGRLADEHRLKDAEKERQLADMRRQIEDLRRKADQGSSQLQGEAGEWQLEGVLREACRSDNITAVSQGVRGADIHHVVLDARGTRAGAILWECKNTRNWSDTWIGKLKMDQRAIHADVAVLVTACLPRGVSRFAYLDGVLVTDFASAAGVAASCARSFSPWRRRESRRSQRRTARAAPPLSHRHGLPPSRRGGRRGIRADAPGSRAGAASRRAAMVAASASARSRHAQHGRDVRGPAGPVPALPSIGLLEAPAEAEEDVA